MQNLERVRTITRNYAELQGLRMVAFGLWFILFAVGALGRHGDMTYAFPALLVVLALYWAIGEYYHRTWGRVAPRRGPRDWAIMCISAAVVLAAWVLTSLIQDRYHLPLSLFGLVLAALQLLYWWWEGRFRSHYLWISGILVLVSLLPLTGVQFPPSAPYNMIDKYNIDSLSVTILGIDFILGGLFDHLLLVRSLKTISEDINGQAV